MTIQPRFTVGTVLAAAVAIAAFVLALIGRMEVLEAILFIALALAFILG